MLGADPNFRDTVNDSLLKLSFLCFVIKYHLSPCSLFSQFGNTALMWACRCGHTFTSELLLAHGADPNIQNNVSILSVFCSIVKVLPLSMFVMSTGWRDFLDMRQLQWIWRHCRATSHQRSWSKYTRRCISISLTHIIVKCHFLSYSWQQQYGNTPLIKASQMGYSYTVELLLIHRADPNVKITVSINLPSLVLQSSINYVFNINRMDTQHWSVLLKKNI